MTDLAQAFAAAFPKAIDFPESEYRARAAEFDAAAKAEGYRLAGFRLGFAVFTTKPENISVEKVDNAAE